ncbi:MAG: sugar nucleotide-binding protein [Bacteroidales bacterium]|jgi:dTDP-4-dehydrorhamnose reductase|nr:sugar nucleotide-binding protein [Bacteroidales bacterium]
MKKILILGATGLAGHTISLYFKEKGYDVIGFAPESSSYIKFIKGDALNTEHLREVLLKEDWDVVINCIGVLNQNADNNKSLAVYLNSFLPHLVADVLKDKNSKLIHMSTDCVFAGNTGPYYENSFKDGPTFYDRTKALGEIIDNKNLTFRNSIVGPDINPNGIGLFNWFMKQNKSVKGFSEAIWTGVTTLTLAKAMEQAINTNLCGLYNLVNNKSISKYDLLHLFNRYFREDSIKIEEDSSIQVDKTLVNTRDDFDFIVPSYEQMISEMKDWVDSHPELYPHYR